jgi:hypothetical protein
MLYRLEEWQGASGMWYCEHTGSHPQGVQKWVIPSRLMGIPADKFITFLIEKYQPDVIFHNDDCSFVGWAWKSQAKMRSYKNAINKLSREKNFQI